MTKPQKIEGGWTDIDNDYCITHKLCHGNVHPDCKPKSLLYLRHLETAEELLKRGQSIAFEAIIKDGNFYKKQPDGSFFSINSLSDLPETLLNTKKYP